MRFLSLAAICCLALPVSAQPLAGRDLVQVFGALGFDDPVFLTHAGDGSGRLFVVERPGTIRVLAPDGSGARTFFAFRNRVNSGPGEAGLLSVAFHPRYRDNGRLFVYYTHGNLTSRVAEFRVSADPDVVDLASERVVLEVDQPAGNHNGGQLAFGPDGRLYVGLGDGGGSNDQFANGQDRASLLGAILRIDVDAAEGPGYAVPDDNPFVGNDQGWREEIWAWGLRNPWRFSFDRVTGVLWAGDVGQGSWEEIDRIVKGGNYGWNRMEGSVCFRSSTCDEAGLELPVLDYPRSDGYSVTGGYVYRGARLSQLYGAYVYGDYGSRRIWALRLEDGRVADQAQIGLCPSAIASFGEDEAGELYVVGFDGRLWQLQPLSGEEPRPTAVEERSDPRPMGPALGQNYPNPFNATTTIPFVLATSGAATLTVYDVLGQPVGRPLDGYRAAGTHAVSWGGLDSDGRPLAPGVYLYRLQTAGNTRVRRLVLIE